MGTLASFGFAKAVDTFVMAAAPVSLGVRACDATTFNEAEEAREFGSVRKEAHVRKTTYIRGYRRNFEPASAAVFQEKAG
jgi:hypothetical protein